MRPTTGNYEKRRSFLWGISPMSAERIEFYRADRPFGEFSNLYRRSMEFEGRKFPTAEHAYQFGKAAKPAVREWMMAAPSPSLLAMAAHGLYRWDIVADWKDIKVPRMRRVLTAKFGQHSDLRDKLLATGDAELVEAGAADNATNRFWGQVNGKGQNTLGVLLMEIRDALAPASAKSAVAVSGESPTRDTP